MNSFFPTEEDFTSRFGKVLYKYKRDWDDTFCKNAVIRKQVFFPFSTQLNDPFDNNIEPDFGSLTPEKIYSVYYFDAILNRGKSNEEAESWANYWVSENRLNGDTLRSNSRENMRIARNTTGFFCLSKVPDSILMWAHYANSGKGFCIGYNGFNLFKSLGISLTEVIYQSTYPIIDPMPYLILNQELNQDSIDSYAKSVSTKAKDWEYEKEVRFFTSGGEKIFTITPECYDSIIFGFNFEKLHMAVSKIKVVLPDVKFYQALPSEREFKISLEEIDY